MSEIIWLADFASTRLQRQGTPSELAAFCNWLLDRLAHGGRIMKDEESDFLVCWLSHLVLDQADIDATTFQLLCRTLALAVINNKTRIVHDAPLADAACNKGKNP
jgi:hypothetical protein